LDAVARTADALCSKMESLSVSGNQAGEIATRLGSVEAENKALRSLLTCLEARLTKLEGGKPAAAAPAPAPAKAAPAPAPAKAAPAPAAAEDEDDFDMFGSDEEEDEEAVKRNAQRVADYHAKKAAKGSK
jgi:elongation factor 1-delta